jgi:hypothetical protein
MKNQPNEDKGGKMDHEFERTHSEDGAAGNTARQTLFITAVISTLFGILYFLGLMGKLIVDGSIHSTSSPAVSMVSAAVGLLWDSTLVILFVALRRQITGRRAIFAELGVAFMILLAACSSINWYVQLALVPQVARSGDALTLALLDVHNVGSVMYAIEHLAWGLFFGLATLFMALAIEGGRIETWIRWLLIAAGVMSILYLPGILAASQFLIDLGYYAAGVILPIATALLAIRFRKDPAVSVKKG